MMSPIKNLPVNPTQPFLRLPKVGEALENMSYINLYLANTTIGELESKISVLPLNLVRVLVII